MADRGGSQGGRSRGRAKAKTTQAAMASAQAAAAAAAQQQAPPPAQMEQRPPPQLAGRAMVRAPAPGPSARRQDGGGGGDAAAGLAPQMRSLDIRDEPAQMGRGAMRGRREIVVPWTRPSNVTSKLGTFGQPVKLQANYFKLMTKTDWCLYQYRVDFEPDEERTFARKRLLALHREKFGGYIFDGTVMFTTCLLRPDPMEVFSKRDTDDQDIKIIIKKTADLSVGDPTYIHLFNIITRKCLEFLELQLVGRDYFNPKAKAVIREYKMELWPGYATSIRQHEDAVLMNVETTHKIMRLETVHDIYNESYQRDNRNWKNLFQNSVLGSIVMTDYNQKTYRVDDIQFEGTPKNTFDMKGVQTSYIDYYQKRYGIRIRDPDQPLLISRTKMRDRRAGMPDQIMLIPELCRATGLTDDMRANFMLMRALADRTRIPPVGRIEKLREFLGRMQTNQKVMEEFGLWNMKLDKDLIELNGRVLPPEGILHGQNAKSLAGDQADWTGSMRNKSLLLPSNLQNWAIIVPGKMKRDAESFAQTLNKASQAIFFDIPRPRMIQDLPDDRSGSYAHALDSLVSNINPQLIMCIVPNNRADRYSAIKKKACVDRCVPTQVVLAKNIGQNAKGIFSIATKIAIQMNCKLGGAPWSVEIPLSGTMVVGFDATRDTGNREKASYGATVCSLNKLMTQYFSAVSYHRGGAELSNHISNHIVNGCLKWREHNNELPGKIVLYRDGVGEGQMKDVFEHEVKEIREKLAALYGGTEPKLVVIVVSKRINTRLFFQGQNPPPGTIADSVITSPERYDFFLVSQSVRQGTVSPTSYNVIYDTVNLPPDKLQRFTYKLTHLYFNWSGTVRVPAPCQYAHKLAMLVGQSIHQAPSPQLADRLYFL